ncbi:MAG: putative OmpA family protein [Treponematales bacterium]
MKRTAAAFLLLTAVSIGAQTKESKVDITGTLDWVKAEISAAGALNLASAGIRLPVGRLQAEETLNAEYPQVLRSFLLPLPVDSSDTLKDLIERGAYSLFALDSLIIKAVNTAPAMSRDFLSLTARCSISLDTLSAELSAHSRPGDLPGVMETVPAADYTSIIIIAVDELPVRGRKTRAFAQPCVFPKIWDTEMNLIYDKSIGNPENNTRIVRYIRRQDIFKPTPSGLDGTLGEFAGNRPLRIIARELFGERPTDLVIDRENALTILVSENNRQLLREHKVLFVLPDRTLTSLLGE